MLDYPLEDVIDLMRQHMDYKQRRDRQQEAQAPAAPASPSSGQKIIYREATDDDDWW